MLPARHLRRYEDAKMADTGMKSVNDGLAAGLECFVVVIEIRDPAQRLGRWRDLVTPRAEDDDRRLDVPEVDPRSIGECELAGTQLVVGEQLIRDELHLFRPEHHRASPPALELQKALTFRIDVGIEIVVLLPVGVCGVEVLEIRDQRRAVEGAGPEIAREGGRPGSAQQAAQITHRAFAGLSRPV